MAWNKLATQTLTVAGDNVTTGTLTTPKKFMTQMSHIFETGTVEPQFTHNNDTGANYSFRYSLNGGADTTGVNRIYLAYNDESGADDSVFGVGYFINITAQEKLMINHVIRNTVAGAGTAPRRCEMVGKWANTSAQITELDLNNTGAGSFNTDTNLTVLGTD